MKVRQKVPVKIETLLFSFDNIRQLNIRLQLRINYSRLILPEFPQSTKTDKKKRVLKSTKAIKRYFLLLYWQSYNKLSIRLLKKIPKLTLPWTPPVKE